MRRFELPGGEIILVRDVFSADGHTIALVSKKRRYGVWDVKNRRWIDGPYRKMSHARARFDIHQLRILSGVDLS